MIFSIDEENRELLCKNTHRFHSFVIIDVAHGIKYAHQAIY